LTTLFRFCGRNNHHEDDHEAGSYKNGAATLENRSPLFSHHFFLLDNQATAVPGGIIVRE
jgi:hypothetical protein